MPENNSFHNLTDIVIFRCEICTGLNLSNFSKVCAGHLQPSAAFYITNLSAFRALIFFYERVQCKNEKLAFSNLIDIIYAQVDLTLCTRDKRNKLKCE